MSVRVLSNLLPPPSHPSFHLFPPPHLRCQNSIGADIIMALDDVVSSLVSGPRIEEAMHRTLRWIDRCKKGGEVGGMGWGRDGGQEDWEGHSFFWGFGFSSR